MHSLADRSIEREIEVVEERPFMTCLSSDGSRLGMTYSGGAAVYSTEPYERIGAAHDEGEGDVRRRVLPGRQLACRRVGRRQDPCVARLRIECPNSSA